MKRLISACGRLVGSCCYEGEAIGIRLPTFRAREGVVALDSYNHFEMLEEVWEHYYLPVFQILAQ